MFPNVVREPPAPSVRVVGMTSPKKRLLTVTAELIVGGRIKFVAPSNTTSLLPGGITGTPETATQFAAVSQAVLTEPFHATIFGLSETVHRPVMSVSELCSTQLFAASLAVSPETVQG